MGGKHANATTVKTQTINASGGQKTSKDSKKKKKGKKKSASAGTFSVMVDLPYHVEDVFKEMARVEAPLGLDPKTMRITVIKNGDNPDDPFSIGYTRKAEYKSKLAIATTVSELIDVQQDSVIKWKMVSTLGPFAMVGVKKAPSVTYEFMHAPQGCKMEVTFEYDYSLLMRPLCCFGMCVPRGVHTLVDKFLKTLYVKEMDGRGYTSNVVTSSTRIQAACHALLIRKVERSTLRREKALGGGTSRKSLARRSTQGISLKEKLDKQLRDKARAKEDTELSKQKALEAKQRLSMRKSAVGATGLGVGGILAERKDVARRTDIHIRPRRDINFVLPPPRIRTETEADEEHKARLYRTEALTTFAGDIAHDDD